VGLREKAKALSQLTEAKSILDEDYSYSKKLLKPFQCKTVNFNRIDKSIEEEKELDDIPEEVDIGMDTVRNPSATKKFRNSFQNIRVARSQTFENDQSEFPSKPEDMNTRRKNVSATLQKSTTNADITLQSKLKLTDELK